MPESPAPDKPEAQDTPSDDLSALSPSQLRAEIARLERVLQNWQPGTLAALRARLHEALASAKRELISPPLHRENPRPSGESRYKQTQTATHLVEQQLLQAQRTVTMASDALRQAKENEQTALNETQPSQSPDSGEAPPPQAEIPPQVLAGLQPELPTWTNAPLCATDFCTSHAGARIPRGGPTAAGNLHTAPCNPRIKRPRSHATSLHPACHSCRLRHLAPVLLWGPPETECGDGLAEDSAWSLPYQSVHSAHTD